MLSLSEQRQAFREGFFEKLAAQDDLIGKDWETPQFGPDKRVSLHGLSGLDPNYNSYGPIDVHSGVANMPASPGDRLETALWMGALGAGAGGAMNTALSEGRSLPMSLIGAGLGGLIGAGAGALGRRVTYLTEEEEAEAHAQAAKKYPNFPGFVASYA